jgi:hypothetical protein
MRQMVGLSSHVEPESAQLTDILASVFDVIISGSTFRDWRGHADIGRPE